MPSYYNRVIGTLNEGELARSSDIHLMQSEIQSSLSRLITDLFGPAFILGYKEDYLTLMATPSHIDQKNINYVEDDNDPTHVLKEGISFYDRYIRQKIITEKSEISSIKVYLQNDSDINITVQAEIRDVDFNLKGEANYILKARSNRQEEYEEATFNFNLDHLPVGEYYFVIRPVDLSEIDLRNQIIINELQSYMFRARMDSSGGYIQGLQASDDGDYYIDANLLPEYYIMGTETGMQAFDENNYDLCFEQTYSSGNTYVIVPGPAIINGQKVYPLDTHISIEGPSSLGDRTDLVYMTADGKINVKKGEVYNKGMKNDANYPRVDNALKIAYITTYKNTAEQWSCPNCGHINVGNVSVCEDCKYEYIQTVPYIEQDDEDFITRPRDVLERIRRLEKKMNYTMDRNSPSRIKYICTIDPIVDNAVKEDTEGTHNIIATKNSDGETIYTPQTGYNVKQLYWSIREQTGLHAETVSKTIKGTITGYNITKVYGTSTPYTVNLKDPDTMDPVEGAIIDITINGVKYSKTTNKQGDATLNVNLQAGTYPVTAVYGDATIENVVVVLAEGSTLPEEDSVSQSSTVKTTRVSTTGVVINGKVISSNVRTGDDAFYKDGVTVDTERGIIELSKTEYGTSDKKDKEKEYVKTTSLSSLNTSLYPQKYVMYKNDTNEYNSHYPVLNINIPHDCSIKSITPNITQFENLDDFGIILFKNDEVFNQKEGMRYAYKKRFKDDPTFPNVFESELVSLKEKTTKNNQIILDTPHSFDTRTDDQDLFLPAGQYSLLIYGNIKEGKDTGTIIIQEAQVTSKTKDNNCGEGVTCLGSVHPSVLYLENSGVTGRTWDCIFEKKNDIYFNRGIIISQGMSMGGQIRACSVSTNVKIPSGCNISTYVSNNGGKTWVNANSGIVTFSGTGSTFKWKYILEGTESETPQIVFNEDKMWAMVFNIGVASSYVEYEDYGSCFETQLIDAERTTAFLLAQPVYKKFSEWEFARLWMEDPDQKSTIDILTSYNEDPVELGRPKEYWPSTMFFNTVFADLRLSDFENTSVDYDDYNDSAEYDENNFRFDFDEDYTYNYNSGEIVARGSDAGDINIDGLDYIDYSYNVGDFSYLYSDTYSNIAANLMKNGRTETNLQKTTITAYYTKAIYNPKNEIGSELWYASTGTNADINNFNHKDIIIGVPFSFGFNIGNNYTGLTIDVYADLNMIESDKNINSGVSTFMYADKNLTKRIDSRTSMSEIESGGPFYVRYIPAGTLEVVVSFNKNGQIEDDNATYGKAYTIDEPIIGGRYHTISVDLTEDIYAYESVRSIGIRFKNGVEAGKTLRSRYGYHDSIGIGTIRLVGYNIRPMIPYDIKDQIQWTSVYADDTFSGGLSRTNDERSAVYKEFSYNEQYTAKGAGWEYYNQVPLEGENGYQNAYANKDENYQGMKAGYIKHDTMNYETLDTSNYHYTSSNDSINTKNNTTSWSYGPNNKVVTSDIRWADTVFEIKTETGNLFKIPVDTPFSAYNSILISYYIETVVTENGDINLVSDTGNIHLNKTNGDVMESRGTFDKGEFYIDFYDEEDLNKNSEPVESFALPAWGRICCQNDLSDRTITSIFKSRSNAKRIKWIVLRRENPKKKTLSNVTLYLRNIVGYNNEKLPAMGPKMMMRIYPNTLNSTNLPRIRKYGVIYKLE